MTDLAQLESEILSQIAAAGDEATLEAVRVAALGKKGSISALLATLGKMSPDERKTQGAAINLAKDKVSLALSARRDILKSGRSMPGLLRKPSTSRCRYARRRRKPAASIRSARCSRRSTRSSPIWDLRSLKVPISRPTTTTSPN